MKKYIKIIGIAAIFIIMIFALNANAEKEELIQIAILLDTSNSMDGLINQAKSQLWKIVNELAIAKKNGKSPKLEVALYEYGKSSIPANEGYMRMILPLTTDLDAVSSELFKLTTNGGDEYCGQVIDSATKGLKWSAGKDEMKVIFIAGNEPFTQGGTDYVKSCKAAIAKGIVVNTIFCGSFDEGVQTKWKEGADLADGRYINIDQNQQVADIKAPQDDEIMKLGVELNKTYIAYGSAGKAKKDMQAEQDKNASSMGAGSLVQRSVAKASVQYDNAAWDLVDAADNRSVNIEEMKDEELPPEMKGMDKKQRREYVEKMMKKRAELQKKINNLNEDRRKFVESEMKKNAEQNTLDSAIIKTVRRQAEDKNFKFK
jgi:hypothetical protein